MRFCESNERIQHDPIVIKVLYHAEIDDLAVFGSAERIASKGIGSDAVGLMEGARDAVAVEVRAEQDRDDCVVGH